jgi:hypothetical protein
MFTLLRAPGVTDADFAADGAAIERDLKTLKVSAVSTSETDSAN